MLALTEGAAEAIETILETTDPGAGVRISPSADAPNEASFQVNVVPEPQESDQVIDSGGGPVYVDADAADYLDDKLLDANVTNGAVEFALGMQA